MPYANICRLKSDGSEEIIAACHIQEEGVVCESKNDIFIEKLKCDGIIDYSSPEKKHLFFPDGRKFLEQLKFNFKSAYLFASDIIEK